MKKTAPQPEIDLANEPYQGPSRKAAAAGEGAIAHYGWGFGGLIGGSLLGLIAPGAVNWVEQGFQQFHANYRNNGNGLVRFISLAAGKIHEWSNSAASHLPGSESLFKHVPLSHRSAVIFGGGLLAVMGFFLSPIYYAFTGVRHANDSRRQFHRQQQGIRERDGLLKEKDVELEALREKYIDTKLELEDMKTVHAAEHGTLRVSPDDKPVMRTHHEDAPAHAAAPIVQAPIIKTEPPPPPPLQPWGERVHPEQTATPEPTRA